MKIRPFCQVLLILNAFPAMTCLLAQKQGPSASQFYQQGVQLTSSSPQQAFKCFVRALQAADPGSELQLQSMHEAFKLGADLEADYLPSAFYQFKRTIRGLSRQYPGSLLTGDLYYWAANVYDQSLQSDSALICYSNALQIRQAALGEKREEVAQCFFGMGDVYKYRLYDFEAAERSYEKALAIRESLNPADEFDLATTYFNLATTNRSQQDYEKAVSYAYRTLALARKMNREQFINATYSILANIYRDINQFDSARHLYRMAISSILQRPSGQNSELLAGLYQGLGEVLKKEGKWDDAISNYDKALGIYRKIELKQSNLFLHTLQQLGEIYHFKRQPDRAMKLYKESLARHRNSRIMKTGSASALNKSLGDLYQQKGLYDSALYFYQQSLISAVPEFNSTAVQNNPQLSSIELKSFVYPALVEKGAALMELFRRSRNPSYAQTALSSYALAEQVLNMARNSLDMEEAKWAFLDANFEIYERSIATAFELYQLTGADSLVSVAFHYFESGKSRSLSDAMQAAEYANPKVQADPLLQERNNYRIGLLKLQDQLKNTNDEKKMLELRNSIVDFDRKMKLNEIEVRKKYPRYFEVKYDYLVKPLGDIQQFARRERAVVLEYFWGNDMVYALGVSGDRVQFEKIGSVDSLSGQIRQLLAIFESDHSGLDLNTFQQFIGSSFGLYRRLVKPFADQYDGKERLVIVPDGLVGMVPFEVLTMAPGSGKSVDYWKLDYLVRKFVTDYAFSSAMLIRGKKGAVVNPQMLAFGLTGSLDDRPDPRNAAGSLAGHSSRTAGGAALELASLAKQFPSGRFFLGDQATKKDFHTEAPRYDLIHLAVHGKGDTEKNYAASLFFKGLGEEGELHWYELYGMKLKASLAVLSACESGIGKTYKGEGMLSMAHAFAYSGCDNMVMGLWKVNDQVSIQLMEKFYEDILEGRRVDESLTLAKRSYLANSDEFSANPRMWGALVAYGDQRVVEKKKGPWIFVLSGALLLLVIGLIIWRRKSTYLFGG